MVKISVRANSQIKTTLLAATAANPAPSSSTQPRQPQHPVYTSQAPCPTLPDPVINCTTPARTVKKPIRANSRVKAALLTATAANTAPSSSNQRGQPQRPVSTTQAPHSA